MLWECFQGHFVFNIIQNIINVLQNVIYVSQDE